jgi:hypothetical protein
MGHFYTRPTYLNRLTDRQYWTGSNQPHFYLGMNIQLVFTIPTMAKDKTSRMGTSNYVGANVIITIFYFNILAKIVSNYLPTSWLAYVCTYKHT